MKSQPLRAPGMGAVTDRAAVAEVLVRTVRTGETGEAVTLDHALKALALRRPGDVNAIAGLEEVRDLELLTELEIALGAEFLDHADHLAGLFAMADRGLREPLRLLLAGTELDSRIAVRRGGLYLHDRARSGL